MSGRRTALARLACVAAGAFVVRIAFVFVARRDTKPAGDDFYYHWLGVLISRGRGFVDPVAWRYLGESRPTAAHPPLYPLFLGFVSRLGFDSVLWHRLASCVVGAVACFVIGVVAMRIASPRAGLLAAGLAALYPGLWINDANLMSESLYVLTIGLVLLTAYALVDRPDVKRAVWLGLACAAAALTRAEAVLLFVVLIVPLVALAVRVPWSRRMQLTGVTWLVGLLCIGPWVGANLVRFQNPETMTSGSGQVLAIGNCDTTYHGEYLGYWHDDCAIQDWPFGCDAADAQRRLDGDSSIPACDESVVDVAARKMGSEYVRDNLGRLPVVMAARVGRALDVYAPFQGVRFNDYFESRGELPSRIGLFTYWLTLPLAVFGAVVLVRRRVTLIPMAAVVVVIVATSALSLGITRYRVPIDVVAIVLAGIGVDAMLARRRANGTASSADVPEPAVIG